MIRTTFLSLVTASFVALPGSVSAQPAAGGTSAGGRMPEDVPRVEQVAVAAGQAAQPATQRPVPKPGASGGSRGARPGQRSPMPQRARVTSTDREVPQGFSVVLVLGDLQGGTTSDNVPAAARKALTDMKDFLPYKSYRLLDVQWTLCCSRGQNTSVVSRLRGADGQEYELSLSTSVVEDRDRLGVRFQLREPSASYSDAGAAPSEVIVELEREVTRLEEQLESATKNAQSRAEIGLGRPADQDQNIQELRSKVAQMEIRLARARSEQRRSSLQSRSAKGGSSRAVIDTSFAMDVGETVVVGTSRVAGGDKALIALLTAVPQKDQ